MSKKEEISVLLINRYFFPDVAAVAQLMGNLAEDLVKSSCNVSVLRGNSPYNDVVNQSDRDTKAFDKIKIHKVPYLDLEGRSSLVHFLNYLTFHLSALSRLITLPYKDVVITFTSPPLISFIGYLAKVLKGARFVHVVEDMYPEVAAELGFVEEDSLFSRVAKAFSGFVFRRADRLVVLSNNMRQKVLDRGVNEEKVEVIPNWNDGDKIYPISDEENGFLDEHDLRDKFVVEYSGHMGEGHNFVPVLNCAKSLQNYKDIVFLLIGDGPRRKEIEEFVNANDLSNVKLLPYQDQEDLLYSLNAADVSLVSLRSRLTGLIVPSKIYGILAAGSPVVYLGDDNSEIARVVNDGECGIVVGEDDTKGLEEAIMTIYGKDELKEKYGKNARSYFMEKFDRKIATKRYHSLIMDVARE